MNRQNAIIAALSGKGVDGFLVSDIRNVRYLSGFSGSAAYILFAGKKKLLFTDPRYEEQAAHQIRGFDIIIERGEHPQSIVSAIKSFGVKTLGFESTVSYGFYRLLLRRGFRLRALSNVVEDSRKIKDKLELKMIQVAIRRAQDAFTEVKPLIRPGTSEKVIAVKLEETLREKGCESLPFDVIVSSGENSSMPHARPTDRKIRQGDLVVVDWGGEAGGYFSDMTRTFLMRGGKNGKKEEIYRTVFEANMNAIRHVKDGVAARMVDKAARDVIKKAGYGENFGHGTGHGVGLNVHELPRISRLGRDNLKSGMVFTIEPGIYIPGTGGVRIEDMVLVEKGGVRVLTSLSKKLDIIG